MAKKVQLSVSRRETFGKANKRLRKGGAIPANLGGHRLEALPIQLDAIDFERLTRAHNATKVITLAMPDKKTETALIRHVQHDPRSGKIVHIDFERVSLTETVTVSAPLHFVGEAPGVKIEGGVLLPILETLEIECTANNIPESIDVDVSSLTEINSMLHAESIALPKGIKLITDPGEIVVKVNAPTVVPVEEPAETEESAEAAAEAEGEGETTTENESSEA